MWIRTKAVPKCIVEIPRGPAHSAARIDRHAFVSVYRTLSRGERSRERVSRFCVSILTNRSLNAPLQGSECLSVGDSFSSKRIILLYLFFCSLKSSRKKFVLIDDRCTFTWFCVKERIRNGREEKKEEKCTWQDIFRNIERNIKYLKSNSICTIKD